MGFHLGGTVRAATIAPDINAAVGLCSRDHRSGLAIPAAECEDQLEEPVMPESFVAKAADMQDGDRRIVVAGRHEIGVFFKDGAYYAYSNYCVHAGGPACEGLIINKVVDLIAEDRTYQGQTFSDEVHFACPWHGYEYDLKTGECAADRRLRLKTYQVVRRGEDIYVVAG